MKQPFIMQFIISIGVLWISACTQVYFQPTTTIDKIDNQNGYRLKRAIETASDDDMLMIMAISGGGSRAAALGYGVLEELKKVDVHQAGQKNSLIDKVDIVFGISGGSVLAASYGLWNSEVVPRFEQDFLSRNLQKNVIKKTLSADNWSRLTSPEFGRGDLLHEELDRYLFHGRRYQDLIHDGKGPFVVISATDMNSGTQFDFTQEYFDAMCLNLADYSIARAVAASSAVPLVFAPITLNNAGGRCHYRLPMTLNKVMNEQNLQTYDDKTKQEYAHYFNTLNNSQERPFIHLLDGGLSDNLGLRSLFDVSDIYSSLSLYERLVHSDVRRIVVLTINAQNKPTTNIDQTAKIPPWSDVLNAVINIPIDRHSQATIERFRRMVDQWNEAKPRNRQGKRIQLYFISLNLSEVKDNELRDKVLNITTSFYLPPNEVQYLKQAARDLLKNSGEYQKLLKDLRAIEKPTMMIQ